MRRALNLLGAIVLTALITYLWVTKDLAEERAARLSLALANAEARASSLEAEAESIEQKLGELKSKQLMRLSSSQSTRTAIASVRTSYSEDHSTSQTGPGRAGEGGLRPDNAVQGSRAWIPYVVVTSPGFTNLVRMEGTSSLHNWQVESPLIVGSAQFGAGLLATSGPDVSPGTPDAKVSVSIPVRSLKSVDATGKAYSDRMDEIMYDKLHAETYSRITYTLTSLTLKEQPDDASTNFIYDAVGQLGVAGKSNTITMPVSLTPGLGGIIQFAGSVQVKLSDFKINPQASSPLGGNLIRIGDEVQLSFAWSVKPLASMAANK